MEMVQMMGVANMGGRAAGGDGTILTAMPQGTVPRGMSMAGMDHGNMPGMEGMAGDDAPAMDHGNMENDAQDPEAKAVQGKEGDATRKMQELHRKMMADPVIRQRVMDDPALHGMMMEVMQNMPGEHDEAMMHEEPAAGERPRPDHAGHKP
ncbi:MAG: hypothetical protein H0W29_19510 [Gemmatimonadales bacterium]|nr:hypothetical protein [Gemmatimonadales bacterium]